MTCQLFKIYFKVTNVLNILNSEVKNCNLHTQFDMLFLIG